MNLIEQLGGYDVAKNTYEKLKTEMTDKQRNNKIFMGALSGLGDELTQYRRENNIYENNDFVVYMHDYENSMLFKVKEISDSGYSYGNDWGWYGVISNMGVGYTFRHATPKEIEAGHRLD